VGLPIDGNNLRLFRLITNRFLQASTWKDEPYGISDDLLCVGSDDQPVLGLKAGGFMALSDELYGLTCSSGVQLSKSACLRVRHCWHALVAFMLGSYRAYSSAAKSLCYSAVLCVENCFVHQLSLVLAIICRTTFLLFGLFELQSTACNQCS
jgi:hypothetical protein